MSANFTNDSFLNPQTSPCSESVICKHIQSSFTIIFMLLILPISVFVLYLGFQRWRQQRSVSSAAIMSHSDFFTYNMAVIELIGVFGYAFYYCSTYADITVMWLMGVFMGSFTTIGQMFFPILTCVERYLAVVHPIIYRGLRQTGGVRIRNISSGCVWLLSVLGACYFVLLLLQHNYNLSSVVAIVILSLIIMTFCSLSVLRVLIRPRPGAVGGDKGQVDQSMQRAIHTILIIMGVLWLKFGGILVSITMRSSESNIVRCVSEVFLFVFNMPSSLVLPLLFLHREGKLPGVKHNT